VDLAFDLNSLKRQQNFLAFFLCKEEIFTAALLILAEF